MIDPTIASQMHNVILMLAQEIREEFDKENKSYIHLDIKVTGRTRDELKLTYSLSTCQFGGNAVTGGSVDRVLMEVLRREKWQEYNDAALLPKPCDAPVNEDYNY